ncbi:MAG: GNAT family N-acetyltransferase [Cyanobacteriota bacterium]|nr:GNAT family N-acetyltransferase [Cyanobacteriota bacterium]
MQFHLPIYTERLVIRRFIPEDLAAYLAFMLDPESTQYLAFEDSQKSQQGATELFNFVCSSYDSENIVHAYAIALNPSNQYIGSCGFSPHAENCIEIYYSINAEYRQQGYAYEATKALITGLKSNSLISEIRAYSSPQNTASLRLAQKLDMISEGQVIHPYSGLEGLLYVLKK